ncbi:IAN13 [Symbiodinium sp. CCMP2592]|nr:IAN13 [Symbiodinium sp. CCMP2592]
MGTSQSTLRALQRARPIVVAAPVVFAIPRQHWRCETHAPGPVPCVPPAKLPQRVLCPAPAFRECTISDGSVRNIVLLGLTGAGKSTLANQMAITRAFKSGDSMSSVTREVQHEEFEFNGARYRVIDTPGFFDTTLTDEQVMTALQQLADVAKEGLVAVIVVVKNGRFTEENQAVIKYIETVLGKEAVAKYGMLVVTNTCKSTDKLQKELAALRDGNLGRDMASKVGSRVLGVDSSFWRWPPRKTRSDIMHLVEELLATNKNMGVDCDVMNWGARVQQQHLLEFEEQTSSLRKQHAEKERMLNECHETDRENIMKEKHALEELLQETEDKHDEMLRQMVHRLDLEENISLALKSRLESTESEMQQMQEDQERRVRDLEAKIENGKQASSKERHQLQTQLADMRSSHERDLQLLRQKESGLHLQIAKLEDQKLLQPLQLMQLMQLMQSMQPMQPMQPMPMMHRRSGMESDTVMAAAMLGVLADAAMKDGCVVQ